METVLIFADRGEDRRTDRQTYRDGRIDVTKLIDAFHDYAKALKNGLACLKATAKNFPGDCRNSLQIIVSYLKAIAWIFPGD